MWVCSILSLLRLAQFLSCGKVVHVYWGNLYISVVEVVDEIKRGIGIALIIKHDSIIREISRNQNNLAVRWQHLVFLLYKKESNLLNIVIGSDIRKGEID